MSPQAYRRDALSRRYRLLRAAQAADAASWAQARRDRARQFAAEVPTGEWWDNS